MTARLAEGAALRSLFILLHATQGFALKGVRKRVSEEKGVRNM